MKKLVIAALVAAAAALGGASIAHAAEGGFIPGVSNPVLSDQDEAVVSAAQETYGYDHERAVALWAGSSEFSVDCGLAQELNNGILDCSWDTSGTSGVGVWIYSHFTDADHDLLGSKPYSSEVVVRVSDKSRGDLDQAMQALSGIISEEYPESNVSLMPDYALQRISVGVGPLKSESSFADGSDLPALFPVGLSRLLIEFTAESGIPIQLDFNGNAAANDGLSQESYSGGLNMPDFGCTAAFTVKDAWGASGIATARHCVDGYDSIAYAGNLYSSPWHMLDYLSGDVAYAAVVGDPLARFQSSPGVFTTVTGYKNPVVGELVCHYGVVSGKKCATVAKVNVTTSFSSPIFVNGIPTYPKVGGLWVTNANVSAQGDSGGPWFIGGVLVGIHSGNFTTNGQSTSAFTRYGAINLLSAWAYGT